jgi:hypothetical protein
MGERLEKVNGIGKSDRSRAATRRALREGGLYARAQASFYFNRIGCKNDWRRLTGLRFIGFPSYCCTQRFRFSISRFRLDSGRARLRESGTLKYGLNTYTPRQQRASLKSIAPNSPAQRITTMNISKCCSDISQQDRNNLNTEHLSTLRQ